MENSVLPPKLPGSLRAQESHGRRSDRGQRLQGGQHPRDSWKQKDVHWTVTFTQALWRAELFLKAFACSKSLSPTAWLPWHWKSWAQLLVSQQTLAAHWRLLAKHAHFGCVSKPKIKHLETLPSLTPNTFDMLKHALYSVINQMAICCSK